MANVIKNAAIMGSPAGLRGKQGSRGAVPGWYKMLGFLYARLSVTGVRNQVSFGFAVPALALLAGACLTALRRLLGSSDL